MAVSLQEHPVGDFGSAAVFPPNDMMRWHLFVRSERLATDRAFASRCPYNRFPLFLWVALVVFLPRSAK